ncbi:MULTISPECIES: amino acid ABC transporter permease [unclassified Mesorhizobium]|uniref:amino acid ABC transporter permease n=1 Tax=unclassified Mesorhizobium TaxID=325217 RepID=UPI000FCB0557|nr:MULTISPECIES: amino acid ABC transporter permease [unclassified Mesorhizobium]TGP21495.1 amino acid ABC transporter permease [Mesorhizobium sp. M1D.F.Ca.ET.231.01.1.1]TGP28941.1 amino acid ABC transporter permease [Mesorhizobium sp. M1D.F.Ca.ET.234.01.1.1]TGS43410.1 amino acid ABC transporter permease [Mesorhizobium sp. M1D.F.Ca.ET.184.01.1.1]TGS59957.1 amino acid ABC transporter permease [Mesorhizobium sp. M1D.F.Ca.ET.183.01.1.1]
MNWEAFTETVRDASSSLLSGLVASLELTFVALLFGYALALLLAIWVMTRNRHMRAVALCVIEVGRGLPLLVMLQLLYYGLPDVGITMGGFVAAAAALAFQTGAYGSEVVRASIQAVPKGQQEAADACGLSRWSSFRDVILPQAVRIAIPPLLSIGIAIFVATSLAFVVTVPEIMSQAYGYGSKTFQYMAVFVLAGIFYAAIAIPASAGVAVIERRLDPHA